MSEQTTFGLENRTVLVTGASGGIGGQIGLAFSKVGANVALQYCTNKPTQLADLVAKQGGRACVVRANLVDQGFEVGLLNEVELHLAKPDILVNCAGDQQVATFRDMDGKAFENMMRTNVASVFALSREFANRANGQAAAIINISSIEASRPAPGHGHYATSKAALEMLTRAMAAEFGPDGIRVNAIAPGLIDRAGLDKDWPQGVESWIKNCPLGRLGNGDDIANAAVFLASDLAGFISGSVLTIDGAMGCTPGW